MEIPQSKSGADTRDVEIDCPCCGKPIKFQITVVAREIAHGYESITHHFVVEHQGDGLKYSVVNMFKTNDGEQ
jgi:hypothetical protein